MLHVSRVGEVTEGQKTIPFATELESGKWLYDSDKCGLPKALCKSFCNTAHTTDCRRNVTCCWQDDTLPGGQVSAPEAGEAGRRPTSVSLLVSCRHMATASVVAALLKGQNLHAVYRGSQLFPKFMEYMKSKKGSEEDSKREDLLQELRAIDADLQKTDGPYVGGSDVNAADLKLGPQLKHVMIGSKSVKVCSSASCTLCGHQAHACMPSWHRSASRESGCCACSNGSCPRS